MTDFVNDLFLKKYSSNNKLMSEYKCAISNTSKKAYRASGKNYRKIAATLSLLGEYNLAIPFYEQAGKDFKQSGANEKFINSRKSISQIYKLRGDIYLEAEELCLIASNQKSLLNDYKRAGHSFMESSLLSEQTGNFIKAAKRANNAVECFEECNKHQLILGSLSIAIRNNLKSEFNRKALYSIIKYRDITNSLKPKEYYSVHYLSLCRKGYFAAIKSQDFKHAYFFMNEILIAHTKYGFNQEDLYSVIIEAQINYLRAFGSLNKQIETTIKTELEQHEKIKYYKTLSVEAQKQSEDRVFSQCRVAYLTEEKKRYRKSKPTKYFSYKIWEMTSNYGESLNRWLITSFTIIVLFGVLYANYFLEINALSNSDFYSNQLVPRLATSSVKNFFTPYYFSIVTFTTLGFGDVTPLNLSAQILIVVEVILGYLMLGGLLSIFTRKLFSHIIGA
jgi:hypothetical protein